MTDKVAVAAAASKKAGLIDSAGQSISLLQTTLLAGRKLTDEEGESLNKSLDYIDALNATDISAAPGINWPVR